MAVRRIKMSEAVTARLKELAAKSKGTLKVGFIDNKEAQIALYNEFGHKGRFPAPARPFFRTMVSNESPKWPEMMASELKRTKFDAVKTLSHMGEEIEGALKFSIRELKSPPLSPVTLALRYLFWKNPQDIRARDVLAAQELINEGSGPGILLPGKRLSRSKKAKPMVTFTQANPLIWTHRMIDSTSYKVESK